MSIAVLERYLIQLENPALDAFSHFQAVSRTLPKMALDVFKYLQAVD